ncbi:MAG TPA: hypothetical protein VNR62_11130, partial [Cellulomonas sp.]|nr:hypothetical protein [Cellulomonas sp.]
MNRITEATGKIPLKDVDAMATGIASSGFKPVELAPALSEAFRKSPNRAVALASAYAKTLPTLEDHRQLFQAAAKLDVDEHRSLVDGYRKAGQAQAVVHAVGLLPRAEGRTIMADLLHKPDGSIDKAGAKAVGYWLRDAGQQLLTAQVPTPSEDHDDALVDFIEDVGDAISDAVSSVIDAIGDAIEDFVAAIEDVVNWIATEVAALARSLVAAFATLGLLFEKVLEAGYEVVRKIIKGLEDIGKSMFQMLDAAFTLVRDSLITILRAMDSLGRTLGQLLSYLVNKAADLVRKGIDALLAIGKTIGNLIEQAAAAAFSLVDKVVRALVELGKAIGEVLAAIVTKSLELLKQVASTLLSIGRAIGELLTQALALGLDFLRKMAQAVAAIGAALAELAAFIATAAAAAVKAVVQGILAATSSLISLVIEVAKAGFAVLKKVVAAVFEL